MRTQCTQPVVPSDGVRRSGNELSTGCRLVRATRTTASPAPPVAPFTKTLWFPELCPLDEPVPRHDRPSRQKSSLLERQLGGLEPGDTGLRPHRQESLSPMSRFRYTFVT